MQSLASDNQYIEIMRSNGYCAQAMKVNVT